MLCQLNLKSEYIENRMKRFLSYIWPITKRIESAVNGTLEITWINGKKILDTKNANYSYGSLQRILKFGLSKIEVTGQIKKLGSNDIFA